MMTSPERIRHALIVEDEGLLLDSMEKSLRRVQWLRISKARTAELALGQIELDPPDVVITDVRMPGMGGLELLDQIRSLRPDVPVVVMTAYGVHLQREALRRGATCFLEKPFRVSELRGVLQLLFASAASVAPMEASNVNFEGRLESLSLGDIVQMVCLSRQNARLELRLAGNATGKVWMRDGSVIDAIFGELQGSPAFYSLSAYGEGRFCVLQDAEPRPRTVHDNWQGLLMESARRYDEETNAERRGSQRPSWRPSLLVPIQSLGPGVIPVYPVPPTAALAPTAAARPTQSLADLLSDFPTQAELSPPATPSAPPMPTPPMPTPPAPALGAVEAEDAMDSVLAGLANLELGAPDTALRAGAEAIARGELVLAREIFERAIARWPEERLLRANLARLARLKASTAGTRS